jgi:hypothetical protein
LLLVALVTNHSSPRGHTAFTFAWKRRYTAKMNAATETAISVAALVLQDLGGGRLRVRRIIGVALSALLVLGMLGVGAPGRYSAAAGLAPLVQLLQKAPATLPT